MQSEVRVTQDERTEWCFKLDGLPPLDRQQARDWLDQQFVQLECTPLRPGGKVLMADKIMTVAREAGPALLGNADWGQAFARAASAALGKPVVRIDLASMTVSF